MSNAALFTSMRFVTVTSVKLAMSAGMKVATSNWSLPTGRIWPIGGSKVKLPGTFAIGFNSDAVRGVPYTIASGRAHDNIGDSGTAWTEMVIVDSALAEAVASAIVTRRVRVKVAGVVETFS